jgi:hypothetical protein
MGATNMVSDDLISLNWLVQISVGNDLVRQRVSEMGLRPMGTRFSVYGTVDTAGYLYVLHVHQSDFAVLHPADGEPDYEEDGSVLRLPGHGARFVAPFDGTVRIVLASGPVPEEEWIDLLGGRGRRQRRRLSGTADA